jgi:vanillate/4-hydroxybenzoate decarboxylase subunit C
MAFQSLRDFLDALQRNGQLVTLHDSIYPEPDIRTYLRAATDLGNDGPAIIFDRIKGYAGYRVAGNVHGSWVNHAILLGMDKLATIREQFFQVDRLWSDLDAGQLTWIDNAPCQEIVVDKGINLYELMPLFRINQNDGGCYFSKACVVSRDPDDPENLNKENVGIYRVMVQGPDTLGMQGLPYHDIARHLKSAEEKNAPLPVAICIGTPPLLTTMAATPLAYEQSEYKAAAALMGEPLEVARAIGSNLTIPANAEYVLEGEVIPRQRFCEGPFGEFPGSYSGVRKQVRIKVKRVTHRRDPIYETLFIGKPWTEHDTLIGLWTSVPLYKQLKSEFPEVKCVNAIYQHGLTVIISSDIRLGGFGKTLAFRLASTPHGMSYGKNIIVVDGDVDPFNLEKVMWALSTRVRADKDVSIIANTPGMPLDPCSEPAGMGCKLIIDATTPAEPDRMRDIAMIADPPGSAHALEKLRNLWKPAGKPKIGR